jgi:hypothetical protein
MFGKLVYHRLTVISHIADWGSVPEVLRPEFEHLEQLSQQL